MEITMKNTKTDSVELIQKALESAISYPAYRIVVEKHVENGTSTGPVQTEALANYTLLNHSRMKRLDKTIKISEEIEEQFKNFGGSQTWLVLTESWCGDAAQSMPAMQKLADLAPHIDMKVVLRDEHLELMNAFLTNGSMSIPKLIMFDNDRQEVVGDWGPRPTLATQMVADYKKEHGILTPEFKQDLQVWYNKDKSQNVISDLSQLLIN